MHARQCRQNLSDEALAAAYLQGDGRAFAAIVDRHTARMLTVARRRARNEQDAQDIVQEAFFKAALNMHTYRAEAALTTWLHRLVVNAGYDHAKRAENKRAHLSLDDEEQDFNEKSMALAHWPLAHYEKIMALRNILARIPSAHRRALMLIDVAGLTVDTAARELGVQPGTVKSRRHRAREQIMEYFSEEKAEQKAEHKAGAGAR